MPDYEKHRLETDVFAVDYKLRLAKDDQGAFTEALTGSPSVVVRIWDNDTESWTDKTAEFNPSSITIVGTKVAFRLKVAGAGEQAKGTYSVRVSAPTDQADTLVETPSLLILDEASG